MPAARLEGGRQPDLFGDDLFLEKRGQHDGPDAGVGEGLGPIDALL